MAKVSRPASQGDCVSISSRKIANGYLVDESRYGPSGYECKTTYSKDAPTLGVVDNNSERVPQANSMSRAIAALNRRK